MATEQEEKKSVWIIGGGLAGLATAAALRRIAGVQNVTVLERTDSAYFFDETAGAAAQLGPNGLYSLQAIGGDALLQRVLDEGHVVTHIGIVLPAKNQTVMVIPDTSVADTGLPQVLIRWGILRKLLQELLDSDITIHTGTGDEICGYSVTTEHRDGVVPVDAQGNPVGPADVPPPSLLVAADGIDSPYQSLVRMKERMLIGPDAATIRKSNVQDNGRVNVKGVVKVDLDYDKYLFKDFGAASLPKGTALAYSAPDGSIACFAGSAGKGYTYWAISVADTVDERGSRTKYFCKTNPGNAELVKQKLLGMMRALNAEECDFAIDLMEATDASKIYAQRSKQLSLVGPSFFSYDSKVVLLGDSAHAFSPAYGQCANFAFEDAVTFATCLRSCDETTNDKTASWHAVLQSYSDQRVGRCEEMFRRSEERISKQAKGEATEDVLKWISRWRPPSPPEK